MAKSQQKTRLAEFRESLGPLGKEKEFAILVGVSRSWLKKASCGLIPVTLRSAIRISHMTGVSALWLTGQSEEKFVHVNEPRRHAADLLVSEYRAQIYREFNIQ